MARDIHYWLVRKVSMARNPQSAYYCLDSHGSPATTTNPKLAMRWLNEDGAKQEAHRLGIWWGVAEVVFPGNELCALQPQSLLSN